MHAPPKPTDVETLSDPAQLEPFDAILFGIPTRYVPVYALPRRMLG